MSKKSQHNNILLAVIGFTAVVVLVGVIGFFTLEQKDDTIQGEVEVSEYRVSCKLPGRVVELRVQEGDYVHVGDTLAILEVPEMKSQEQMLQATNAATEAMKDLTDAGARKEQIKGAYELVQQAEAAAAIAKKTYERMQNLYNEGVISGQKRDEAFAAFKATEAQVAAAKSQYEMAKNGAREQEKRVAASNTQASKSAVDVVKNLLKETVQIAQCGALLGLHWMLFYCSIKASNVSIGVVCFALVGFFTAIFEPIIFKRKISWTELLLSLITVAGLLCIFSFDSRYRYGITIGVVSSAVCALYAIFNKKVSVGVRSRTMLFFFFCQCCPARME